MGLNLPTNTLEKTSYLYGKNMTVYLAAHTDKAS